MIAETDCVVTVPGTLYDQWNTTGGQSMRGESSWWTVT